MNSMPLLLNTSKPSIQTIRDFGPDDKIALPAVNVSIQAMLLQMAAEKDYCTDRIVRRWQNTRLDSQGPGQFIRHLRQRRAIPQPELF